MSQTTSLLLWVHWIQFGAERLALAGAGLFAGAQLYRSLLAQPRLHDTGIEQALTALQDFGVDRLLAGLAGVTALAAVLACLGGAGVAWLVPGIADGLAAVYLMTEVRRTSQRAGAMTADTADTVTISGLLDQWRRQQAWVAATGAVALLMLVLLA